MSRHYPTWDQTHWDYEKGNLDAETKRYAVEAARRVKASGGVIHFFALGQTMEQEDVGWLKEIVAHGHPVGNHTYDHVNVMATRAGGHPVPLSPGALVDRGEDPRGGHRRQHPPGRAGPETADRDRAGRLPHPRRVHRRPGRPPRPAGDAPEDGVSLGEQQVPARTRSGPPASRPTARSSRRSSRPRHRPSRSFTRRA